MYGLQYQRSYSTGVIVAGSRSEKASAGLVSALTSRRRYSPGRPARSCAISSGARIELSSRPPVETMPVIVSVCGWPPASILSLLPALQIQTPRKRRARNAFFGTVRKPSAIDMPPRIGGRNSRCKCAAVGNWNRVAVPCADQFLVRSSLRSARTRSPRAHPETAQIPSMLLRQKIVFNLPRSPSGK